VAELLGIESGDSPSAMHGRGRYDQVVGANHLARLGQLCPEPGMHPRRRSIQRYDFKTPKGLLQPAASPSGTRCILLDFDSKSQL
jgi:hypothetical protein